MSREAYKTWINGRIFKSWNWVSESEQSTGSRNLVSATDINSIQNFLSDGGSSQSVVVTTDLRLHAYRDDSYHNSYVRYLRLDNGKEETFSFKGGYADNTQFFAGTAQSQLFHASPKQVTCGTGSSRYVCHSLKVNTPVDAVLRTINLCPRCGSAHKGQWSRNRYTFTGSFYQVQWPCA